MTGSTDSSFILCALPFLTTSFLLWLLKRSAWENSLLPSVCLLLQSRCTLPSSISSWRLRGMHLRQSEDQRASIPPPLSSKGVSPFYHPFAKELPVVRQLLNPMNLRFPHCIFPHSIGSSDKELFPSYRRFHSLPTKGILLSLYGPFLFCIRHRFRLALKCIPVWTRDRS